jgi:hypothetical protein
MGKSRRLGNHPTRKMILHPLRPQRRHYLPPRYPGWVMSGDQAVKRMRRTEMSDKVLRLSACLSSAPLAKWKLTFCFAQSVLTLSFRITTPQAVMGCGRGRFLPRLSRTSKSARGTTGLTAGFGRTAQDVGTFAAGALAGIVFPFATLDYNISKWRGQTTAHATHLV